MLVLFSLTLLLCCFITFLSKLLCNSFITCWWVTLMIKCWALTIQISFIVTWVGLFFKLFLFLKDQRFVQHTMETCTFWRVEECEESVWIKRIMNCFQLTQNNLVLWQLSSNYIIPSSSRKSHFFRFTKAWKSKHYMGKCQGLTIFFQFFYNSFCRFKIQNRKNPVFLYYKSKKTNELDQTIVN